MFLPEVLVPFALIQLFEEVGWMGFMQDTMQERHGPLLASILAALAVGRAWRGRVRRGTMSTKEA